MPDLRLLKVHIPSIPQLPLVIGLFFPSLFRLDDVLCLLDNPQLIRLRSARPLSPIRELSTIASSFLLMLLSRHSLSSPIARAHLAQWAQNGYQGCHIGGTRVAILEEGIIEQHIQRPKCQYVLFSDVDVRMFWPSLCLES